MTRRGATWLHAGPGRSPCPATGDAAIDCSEEALARGVRFVVADCQGAGAASLAEDADHDVAPFKQLVPELNTGALPAEAMAAPSGRSSRLWDGVRGEAAAISFVFPTARSPFHPRIQAPRAPAAPHRSPTPASPDSIPRTPAYLGFDPSDPPSGCVAGAVRGTPWHFGVLSSCAPAKGGGRRRRRRKSTPEIRLPSAACKTPDRNYAI
ncbi:hypothetical protein BRADI_4g10454v3 [Brachypodium distachyon]|uniref:Uncharacterized protein n=1 Tax=Brachypodium distachyon TaxID=15368 RepID=A0A2K2CLX4_BRADI|nr:hypothetical protein BRADI_4g10454v3 [Brachypodium distachyon]